MPSKIPCSVILQRIKTEQAGFRQERSCVDQIATLRIIVEQTIEWQTSLCMNFVDFEKAFDSIDRLVLWKIRKHYGIPQKIISIKQQLYDGFSCQVIHNGNLTAIYCYYLCKTRLNLLSSPIFDGDRLGQQHSI